MSNSFFDRHNQFHLANFDLFGNNAAKLINENARLRINIALKWHNFRDSEVWLRSAGEHALPNRSKVNSSTHHISPRAAAGRHAGCSPVPLCLPPAAAPAPSLIHKTSHPEMPLAGNVELTFSQRPRALRLEFTIPRNDKIRTHTPPRPNTPT